MKVFVIAVIFEKSSLYHCLVYYHWISRRLLVEVQIEGSFKNDIKTLLTQARK